MVRYIHRALKYSAHIVTNYTLVLLAILSIGGVSSAYIYLSDVAKKNTERSLISSASRYLEALAEFRTLYTSEVIKTVKQQGITVTHNYKTIEGAIPLPATLSMELGVSIGRHQSGAKTFLYSGYPFPWRIDESRQLFSQDFVKNAWKKINANPDLIYYQFETYQGRPSIRYAIADRMRAACIDCHNDHPQTPKSDWKVGDVRGVMEVILPIDLAQIAAQSTIDATFIVLSIMTLLLSLVIGIVFTRMKKDRMTLSVINKDLLQQRLETETTNDELQIVHQQLKTRAEELTLAVQTKSEFLARMSHEIRTPMNGVIGMLGLLMKSPLNNDQQHKTNLAKSSAESLLTLINDILDFSKIDAGKMELEILDFDLRDQLGDFVEVMAQRAQEKNIEIVMDLTGIELSMVRGDPSRLRQILTNLMSNAIKFTSKGEIVFRANLVELETSRLQLTCEVFDTGIGIPPHKLDTLFNSFSQVDASTTRQYGGTGLGLAIVKQLCEIMHGNIEVTSQLGKGSCFKFSILLDKSQSAMPVVPDTDVSGLNLLIVDNNKTNLSVLASQLEAWQVNVITASEGFTAIKICEQRVQKANEPFFDAALIDFQMPDMDGMALGRALLSDNRFANMKCIMMTDIAHAGNTKEFAKLGFSGYFPKPATTRDLFRALALIINQEEPLSESSRLLAHHTLQTLNQDSSEHKNLDEKQLCWSNSTRILLVDDNHINQEVAKGILLEFGIEADIASNGIETIAALKLAPLDSPYQMILMDCFMPEMDGYEATRQIRLSKAGARFKDITIIAMTANAMKGDREKCLAAGMSDYLPKPIDPALLLDKLIQWLPRLESEIRQPIIDPEEKTDLDQPQLLNWDYQSALKRMMNEEKLLVQIVALFVSDMPKQMIELELSLQQKDLKKVGRTAHSIKGVAANLSCIELERLATTMEVAASKSDFLVLETCMSDIVLANRTLLILLEEYLNKNTEINGDG